jgi:hypothetical protein
MEDMHMSIIIHHIITVDLIIMEGIMLIMGTTVDIIMAVIMEDTMGTMEVMDIMEDIIMEVIMEDIMEVIIGIDSLLIIFKLSIFKLSIFHKFAPLEFVINLNEHFFVFFYRIYYMNY